MYMRTGSVVRPNSLSTDGERRGSGLGGGDVVGGAMAFRCCRSLDVVIGCRSRAPEMPMSLIIRTMSSICSGSDDPGGQVIVDLGVGQEALLLALGDQGLQTRLLGHGVVHQAPCM
jgi:hypothetical protein